jgi:hypothetical protein
MADLGGIAKQATWDRPKRSIERSINLGLPDCCCRLDIDNDAFSRSGEGQGSLQNNNAGHAPKGICPFA